MPNVSSQDKEKPKLQPVCLFMNTNQQNLPTQVNHNGSLLLSLVYAAFAKCCRIGQDDCGAPTGCGDGLFTPS